MLLVISQETYEIDKKFKKFLTPNSISYTPLKTDQSAHKKHALLIFSVFHVHIFHIKNPYLNLITFSINFWLEKNNTRNPIKPVGD
jgi:hypothetical protein